MNEELLKRLDMIAAKLGVAAEHLWMVVLRQVQLEAWAWILVGVPLWLGAVYGAHRLFMWSIGDKYKPFDDDLSFGVGILVCFVAFLVTSLGVASSVLCLLNPEYYALKTITGMLK